MNGRRPRLAFVSPLFLFPNDAGGKIRSTNILRGLKGGRFEVTLASPASEDQRTRWASDLEGVCDEFVPWAASVPRPDWRRGLDLFGELPVNVMSDRTPEGLRAVKALADRPDIDLMVFDFVHSAVLRPDHLAMPAVCFTHNVEAEIFARHAQQAAQPWRRWVWANQHRKMLRFEARALRRFRRVVAVSERDAEVFRAGYGLPIAETIPTGVDLDFFAWSEPPQVDEQHPPCVVFTGSMDWAANIGGVEYFLRQVWPMVLARQPQARFVVVGRNPPAALQALGQRFANVAFTGFVDDVRPYVRAAHAFVIPLLVGGGTRIKAFEAMAMGCTVVSTSIGIEGLDVRSGEHYLLADDAQAMSQAIVRTLEDRVLRKAVSVQARHLVESRFGHRQAAQVFEDICLRALGEGRVL